MVMLGNRLNCWNTMPIRSRILLMSISGEVMSVPSKKMWPPVGCSSRLRERRKVDLPQPEGPMMAMTSPLVSVRLISRSTWLVPNCFCRCSTRMRVLSFIFGQSFFQFVYAITQCHHDGEIDECHCAQGHHGIISDGADDIRAFGKIHQSDISGDGGLLEQGDEVIADSRQHIDRKS